MLKLPPHSLQAEQSVIWSLLIDKEWFLVIWDMLASEDFYEEAHANIFDEIRNLFEKNKAIDIITVKEKLDSKKLLEKIWGFNYLAELTEIVPTSANIFEYAQIVKNKSVLRKLIKAWNEIVAWGYDEETILAESNEEIW